MMNTNRSVLLFLSSLLLLSQTIFACTDYPSGEYTRVGSFYRFPKGMEAYMPFIYTFDLYYTTNSDPLKTEKTRNLSEWQKEVGDSVTLNDIEVVLYQAKPNMVLMSAYYGKLQFTFEGNTFVDFLMKPEHQSYLNYVIVLKQMEYLEFYLSDLWAERDQWSWNSEIGITSSMFKLFSEYYIDHCKKQMAENRIQFLKERYHYQLAKILLKSDRIGECLTVLDDYFQMEPNTIVNNAMWHYKGVCMTWKGDSAMADLCFARSFRLGDERKFRNMQCSFFSPGSLDLTTDKSEQALLLALGAMRNPGKALAELKRIVRLDAHIPEFLFLVYREVNKFDDWIAGPVYADLPPSVTSERYWAEDYDKIAEINLVKDKAYLKEFMAWLAVAKEAFSGESRQYLDLAYVHLCLLNEDYATALNRFNSIRITPSDVYYRQYLAEQIYLKIMSPDFDSDANLNAITRLMQGFEPTAKHDILECKMLYSLNLILSSRMKMIGRKAYAGLILLKSDVYAAYYSSTDYPSYFSYNHSNGAFDYNLISWFDKNASIADVDTLIQLSLNTKMKPFQKFFTDSIMAHTDDYRDLKGMLAFRQGNLALANAAFKQMNPRYWDSYELQENPFVPKYWPQKRSLTHKFSKLEFTNELVRLTNQTESQNNELSAQAWLKLGHGYYNTTYWGNAWMMNAYYFSTYYGNKPSEISNPYYNCSKAKQCYLNVIRRSKDNELLATATFMVHACEMNNAVFGYATDNSEGKPEQLIYKSVWLKDFVQKYRGTKVFQSYLSNCSYLKEHSKKGHLKLNAF